MKLLLVQLFTFTIMGAVWAHPLHLSISNIDIDGDTAKIAIKVFDNEWFLHLAACYPEITNTNKADSSEFKQQFIINYFEKTLLLTINNNVIKLNFANKKAEDGIIWYNYVAIIPTEIEKCIIENRILTECYGDQKNLTVIKKGNYESGLEFDSTHTNIEVKLK